MWFSAVPVLLSQSATTIETRVSSCSLSRLSRVFNATAQGFLLSKENRSRCREFRDLDRHSQPPSCRQDKGLGIAPSLECVTVNSNRLTHNEV